MLPSHLHLPWRWKYSPWPDYIDSIYLSGFQWRSTVCIRERPGRLEELKLSYAFQAHHLYVALHMGCKIWSMLSTEFWKSRVLCMQQSCRLVNAVVAHGCMSKKGTSAWVVPSCLLSLLPSSSPSLFLSLSLCFILCISFCFFPATGLSHIYFWTIEALEKSLNARYWMKALPDFFSTPFIRFLNIRKL